MNKREHEGFMDDAEPVTAVAELPPQEEAAAPPPDVWPLVIKLAHKPVQKSIAETVKELTFREPTAGDIMRAGGNPVRVEVADVQGNQIVYNFRIDDQRMIRLMASLSGVFEPYLMKMDPRDYNSCAYRLQRFFISEQGMW